MKKFTKEAIQELPKIPRLNLINSCTGYKSANLIATKTAEGVSNVAIFSSITHLGSDPALLGFILRPTTVPRNTYKNIKDVGFFSVNHITESMIADAHHSSANYEEHVSEFDKTNLEETYYEGISIPFVKGSPVQIFCKYLNEYEIKENGTIHIIASIEELFVEENLIQKDHWLRLDEENVVAINGLDGYCVPKLVDRFDYARPNVPTKSIL
ncbi:MAG: flavin reductase [Flavobacteriales bacterium]|nr:flavin reductase [Flavobacteriales bacterium]